MCSRPSTKDKKTLLYTTIMLIMGISMVTVLAVLGHDMFFQCDYQVGGVKCSRPAGCPNRCTQQGHKLLYCCLVGDVLQSLSMITPQLSADMQNDIQQAIEVRNVAALKGGSNSFGMT